MSKFWAFFNQIYMEKTKSKSFLISTLIYMIIAVCAVFWSDIKEAVFDRMADDVAIVNETNLNEKELFISDSSTKFHFLKDEKDLKENIKEEKYIAAIKLTDENNKLNAKIISNESLDLDLQKKLEALVDSASTPYVIDKLSLTKEQTKILVDKTPIITAEIFESDGKTSDEKSVGQITAYICGFVIFIFVTNYLAMIISNIASEKGSRNLEMIFVNTKPETHFKAKLLGVFAVAATQAILMIGVLLIVFSVAKDGQMLETLNEIVKEVSALYFLVVFVFLVVSVFFFLILGALFGSLVSKPDEAQQVTGPVMIISVASFYVMLSGLFNPDTLLIKIFSYLPFASGMVMPMRMGATDIGNAEVFLSLGILIVVTIILYFVAISFYKRSVLTYSSGGVIEKIKAVFKYTT